MYHSIKHTNNLLIKTKGHTLSVVVLLVTCCFLTGFGQWRATSYISITKTKFNLAGVSPGILTDFCFPQINECRAMAVNKPLDRTSGFISSALILADWNRGSEYFYRNLSTPALIRVNLNTARLTICAYTENVSKFLVIIHAKTNGFRLKEFDIDGDGYQLPSSTYLLGTWGQDDSLESIRQELAIDSISLVYQPREKTRHSKMFIGQLDINEISAHEAGLSNPWIDKLVGDSASGDVSVFDQYSEWSLNKLQAFDRKGEKQIPNFENFGTDIGFLPVLVEFSNGHTNRDEQALAAKLILQAAQLYPYYNDRGLNKDHIMKNLDSFFEKKDLDQKDFWRSLREEVHQNFKDPHFEVILPDSFANEENQLVNGPIRVKNVAGNTLVSAVFCERCQDSIPVGSEVYSLDGKLVANLREEDVEKILLKKTSDTLHLAYHLPGYPKVLKNASIPYNQRFKVGNNFKPRHGEFRFIDSNIIYYRINNWMGDNFLNLINTNKKINNAGNLIIDLRNNGGGYGDEVLQVLSLFYDEPKSIGVVEYPWFKESMLVIPEKKIFRFHDNIRVFIMVDGGTACASEIFTIGMKLRKKTWIVGDAPTMGAIASPALFRFPSGAVVRLHTSIRRYYFDPTVYKEGRGIDPDIWISRTHPRDTYPYEDKALKETISILKTFETNTPLNKN